MGIGHGAAAWIATLWLDRSYGPRAASGSDSRRWNIVGTHWLCVTRYCSMNRSAGCAPNFSMITTVAPRQPAPCVHFIGAA